MAAVIDLAAFVEERLLERNRVSSALFPREAPRLAEACRRVSERFLAGGRLLAFGRGPYATDAQHVSVEFVHPVIVGKRALPALDLSFLFAPWVAGLLRPEDIVMGFGPPQGDPEVWRVLDQAQAKGALTFALPGLTGDYALAAPSSDPFIHQEMLEVVYHTLWETVHVFFEHREMGDAVGEAGFLYPFLGGQRQDLARVVDEVAASIVMKAQDDERLRDRAAREDAQTLAECARAIWARVATGGKIIVFGNGGSATDANDFAVDCVAPPLGYRPIPAVSLALEPANITAVANDVGPEVIFLRQMIAHARPEDVAVAISTSGGSANVVTALEWARKRGLMTVGLLGADGGEVTRRNLVDIALVAPSESIPRIQEAHASLYHVLRETIEVAAGGGA